jgi:trypsin
VLNDISCRVVLPCSKFESKLKFEYFFGIALPRSFRAVPGGGKIVGGENAAEGELKYQLSLQWFGSHICGASLVAPNLAVTAAHCVEGDVPGNLKLVAGEHNRNTVSGNEQTLSVSRIVVHENYDSPTIFSNDIALLFLSTEAVLNSFVDVVPIPPQMANSEGTILVSGWGTTRSGGQLATVLQKVSIPIVSDADCQRSYPDETIQPSMLCAGLTEGGKDSCQGDSGGPLVAETGPTAGHLVGIVSWGYGCAAAGYPGVNTEVSHFNNWIAQQVAIYNASQ